MKDYRQIDYINKYIEERMKHCYDAGYEQGESDMLECIKKLEIMLFNPPQFENCFDKTDFYTVITTLSPFQIREKIKEYEEKQKRDNEIKVGDEVRRIDRDYDCRVVVTSLLAEHKADTINYQGCHYQILLCEWEKTGRTFPEIAEVLDKMKGGAE